MARTIGQRELRNNTARIVDDVAQGETFVVTRRGAPVAELRPINAGRATFVSRSILRQVVSGGPRLDAGRFRADLDAIFGGPG